MSSDEFYTDKWLKKIDQQTRELLDRHGWDRKTSQQVFDQATLLRLGKLFSDQIITHIDFPISTGKEANIFRAVVPSGGFVVLKIYRTSTLTFKHITKYIEGDPRFKKNLSNRRIIINEWAKKEFRNLELLQQAKIRVPAPVKRLCNILIMEYIGSKKQPAPLLKDVVLKQPQETYDILCDYLRHMYQNAGLIHADLSPYNILIHRNKPVIIDVGQAVLLEHPMSSEFLNRDITNMILYFKRYGIFDTVEKRVHTITS